MKLPYHPIFTLAIGLGLSTGSWAQNAAYPLVNEPAPEKTADEIARELANPNNSLASLTFKNQYRFYDGTIPGSASQDNFTLLFQPVFPFSLEPTSSGGKANLFVRPAFPLLFEQPVFDPATTSWEGVTALGDIGFDIGYGVTESNGFLWAVGMVGTLPSATDSRIAGGQVRLGPELLLAKFEDWGVYGIFPSHQWNVAGWRDGEFNTSQMQVFLNFLPGGGWTVGTTPIMNYNWKSNEWTIPLNLTVGKTVMFGKTPVKLQAEINYYIERPENFGSDWMIGFNVTPVVNNFVEKWIRGN
ncbi:hypothetical protein [Haloferula rosea]|uniref:Neuromedin U n=1 Tax=Haloferula rosea TaxID=490093 RepID=A0A934VAI1_9BACT|nr:hypothetical protein [Haloferula rosea]MBK1826323.1 hypothetical protein [Haloferula rosea]